MIAVTYIDTPVGKMRGAATDAGICVFDFDGKRKGDVLPSRIETIKGDKFEVGEHPLFEPLRKQVAEYFEGTRMEFDLPLDMVGTAFQQRVWNGLLQIPYAETRSYKQQSIFLGDEKAIRAVASANGDNNIAIIIPCHRVIGSNGSLVGFGGGLPNKKWLLDHERKHAGKEGQGALF